MQISLNKRKRFDKKRVQLPHSWLVTGTWALFSVLEKYGYHGVMWNTYSKHMVQMSLTLQKQAQQKYQMNIQPRTAHQR